MNYVDQYVRDIYTLIHSDIIRDKVYMFFFYNYLCVKNVIGKIFGIKYTSQQFKQFTIHFGSFNAFFAIFTELFIYNIYYFETAKKNPYIVDCWGNIGMAVLYFKYLYPESIIDTYEPDRETFGILSDNVKRNNLTNVRCIDEAISGESGEMEFYSFGDMAWGPGNTLERSQVNFKNINSYKVKVSTLSSKNYEYIDFLKIDIEGAEGKLFQDLDETDFIKKVGRISLEYHYDEGISHNVLSSIISILERNNMHIIINANNLVGFYISHKAFVKRNNKYVLMIDAIKA